MSGPLQYAIADTPAEIEEDIKRWQNVMYMSERAYDRAYTDQNSDYNIAKRSITAARAKLAELQEGTAP